MDGVEGARERGGGGGVWLYLHIKVATQPHEYSQRSSFVMFSTRRRRTRPHDQWEDEPSCISPLNASDW